MTAGGCHTAMIHLEPAMPHIDDDAMRDIRKLARIEVIAAEYTTLKRSGRSLKGRCPVHEERSPSFVVTPSKGLWKCFGCGAGGDAIALVAQVEHVRFPEAVRRLASRVGYSLDDTP